MDNLQIVLDRIKNKLSLLKSLDKGFEIFGSRKHNYQFNKVKSEKQLIRFEKENGITLPIEYREFLKHIGNGGAGPYYGLERLENGREVDLDYPTKMDLIDLSKPFPFTKHWNVEFGEITEENYEAIEERKVDEYYANRFINGLLRIANFGCAVSMNLVVNGKEKGNVWVDDRGNDNGLFPDPYFVTDRRLSFLEWYELWLDKSIEELKEA